jgi:predicted nucleotidyltransferase
MESELENIIGNKVDLKTEDDLSPYFREQVLSSLKVVYG